MNELYLGVDVGSISTKGVLIDEQHHIIAHSYVWTEGNPMEAVRKVIHSLKSDMPKKSVVVGVGVTGSARKFIGSVLQAGVIKNEITAHAVGTLTLYPDVKTILEIGGQDSKIIIIEDGIVVDYAMNTLCAAGTGSFLSSQAKRLGIDINEFGQYALLSEKPTKIAARCTVFAESDLVHKAGMGAKKEDIVAGLCEAVVHNYLNNVGKGKKIKSPIVFQGGVSKNGGVVKAFEKILGFTVHTFEYGHLMGAFGVAILSKKNRFHQPFSFDMEDMLFETKGYECKRCSNHCDIMAIYRNHELLDVFGNRCERGNVMKEKET